MRLLAAAFLAALTLAAPAAADWTPRPATYGVGVTQDVRITMSDGVVLRADVLLPTGGAPGERFPVLVTQTPYNKAAPRLNFRSDYLITRGYAQVIVDVRGTGGSEGSWDSFGTREQLDGPELVEWARTQPWSDGRVGLHGTSYGAINQIHTAARQPEGLKAIFPIVPAGDIYRDIVASGGQVNTSFIPVWLGLVTGLGLLPPTYTPTDPVSAARVIGTHVGNTTAFQGSVVLDAMTGGANAFDGPFYRERSPLEKIDDVEVPTFLVGGWFDLFQRGTPMLFQRLMENKVPTRLIEGPWYHITAGQGLPAEGMPWSLDQLELRWFDRYVRGVHDPDLDKDVAPMSYFENGSGKWLKVDEYPSRDVEGLALRLSGAAAPGRPGRLTTGAATDGADTLVANPTTGVCSRSTGQWTAGAAAPPCETDNRVNDLYGLSYDLPVEGEALRLFGPMTARLFVTSANGRDAQLTARVEDVAPDGTATQLTAGWQVLSLRANDASRSEFAGDLLVKPFHPFTQASELPIDDEPMEVLVEIFNTGAAIAPGHTLRLTLQTADAPHLTAPLPQAVDSAGAVLGIVHDAQHPSALHLSVR